MKLLEPTGIHNTRLCWRTAEASYDEEDVPRPKTFIFTTHFYSTKGLYVSVLYRLLKSHCSLRG